MTTAETPARAMRRQIPLGVRAPATSLKSHRPDCALAGGHTEGVPEPGPISTACNTPAGPDDGQSRSALVRFPADAEAGCSRHRRVAGRRCDGGRDAHTGVNAPR